MTTATAVMPKHIPVNGKPVRFRLIQVLYWSAAVAVAGAALVAGGYYLITQQKYGTFTLKDNWDNLFHYASWKLYRHGVRDLGEPAIATLWVKTILAKPSTWNKRAGPVRLIATPFLVIAIAGAMIIGGIWLLDFGFPNLWHAFGWHHLMLAGYGAHLWATAQTVLLGVIIGLVIHRLWAPAGATIQGYYVDKSVDRAILTGHTPAWVTYPLAPPMVRERFSWIMSHDPVVSEHGKVDKWVIIPTTVFIALIVIVGLIAHFWIGTGHPFPVLAP